MRIDEQDFCPECFIDWKWADEKGNKWSKNFYGLEDPMVYDGVSWWVCENCDTTWDRFTNKKVDKPIFKRRVMK